MIPNKIVSLIYRVDENQESVIGGEGGGFETPRRRLGNIMVHVVVIVVAFQVVSFDETFYSLLQVGCLVEEAAAAEKKIG